MSRHRDPVPDVLLERYRLGELPAADADRLAGRLQEDDELRRRLEALEASDAEIRRLHPSARLAERVRARLGPVTTPPPGWWAAWALHWPVPAALAVAATLALVLSPRVSGPPGPAPSGDLPLAEPPSERIKGSKPGLALFRKTPEGSEVLADGDVARAGDLVRVGYRAAGRRYGVILSLDGRGSVTLHLPEQGTSAARLRSADVVLLDHAYELDDAPRWERFFFVTAELPFDVAPVLAAARRAQSTLAAPGALSLPAPLEQSAFLLHKEK